MSERRFEVKPVGVDYVCDVCNTGLMVQVGLMLPTDPPQWKHKCSNCGDTKDFFAKYPDLRFERIEP
jgi:hypothetical protein